MPPRYLRCRQMMQDFFTRRSHLLARDISAWALPYRDIDVIIVSGSGQPLRAENRGLSTVRQDFASGSMATGKAARPPHFAIHRLGISRRNNSRLLSYFSMRQADAIGSAAHILAGRISPGSRRFLSRDGRFIAFSSPCFARCRCSRFDFLSRYSF